VPAASSPPSAIRSPKAPGLGRDDCAIRVAGNESSSRQQVARRLIKPEELMQRLYDDEQIVLVRNGVPLRCWRAIYFLRPEMLERVRLCKVQSVRSKTSR
jgi:type IV secretory pathway TraG/TraD family ATPase VirD4